MNRKFNSNTALQYLQIPTNIVIDPISELEESFTHGIKTFKLAINKRISPNAAVKDIFISTRCFCELDYKSRSNIMNQIPSEVGPSRIYCDMSIATHKIDCVQTSVAVIDRKVVKGCIRISVEHAFMLLIYLAGNNIALGYQRVNSILKRHNLPLNRYGYSIVKKRIEDDYKQHRCWITSY